MDTREVMNKLHNQEAKELKTTSTHAHEHGADDYDYMKAVAEYKKTFASKKDVIEKAADPAVREMLLHMEKLGIDTPFDRFDQQKPQCSFGIAGVCCRICTMGPCKITAKSPKGVCGADADLIVARNILRTMAGGVGAHGSHGREVILALRFAAEGKLDLPILGENILRESAPKLGIKDYEKMSVKELAMAVSDVLLADMSRSLPDEYQTIKGFAPLERQE